MSDILPYIVIACSLLSIAITLVVATSHISRLSSPIVNSLPQRSQSHVYTPITCGVSVVYQDHIQNCARHRGHDGRCLCDEEMQAAADELMINRLHQTMLVPSSSRDEDLRAFVAQLGQHIDQRPDDLKHPWVLNLVLMSQAMREKHDWGVTKEHRIGDYRE